MNIVKYLTMKYTVKDLQTDFPDDAACLEWLVNFLYPDGITCKSCDKVTKHHRVKKRQSYACDNCGQQTYPMAGTIFHRSTTPLTLWFYAIYLMSSTRSGVSAKQIERELGVTYKTAWRMMHQIRIMMADDDEKLEGKVEIDEAYIHANVYKRSSARKRYGRTGRRAGEVLFGMVERGGRARLRHVPTPGVRVLQPQIHRNISKDAVIYSDEYGSYRSLRHQGYKHLTTNHSRGEYVDGDNYTQNIENVWSHLKRGIKGVYRHVSPKHLQAYANEFAWRYSNRNKPSLFWSLLCRIDA